MTLKHHLISAAVLVGASLASISHVQIRAAQEPILSYCPSHAGAVDCATAVKLFLQFAEPSDDELVTIINTIVAQLSVGHHSRISYNSTVVALGLLASAIDDARQRSLAADLAGTLADDAPPAPAPVDEDFKSGGGNKRADSSTRGGASGNASSTSGDGTSGSSGTTGSTSGDGTSGSSGTTGSTSGDGTSGSSGTTGSTSGDGTSGSSGTTGSTSGDGTSGTSGTSGQSSGSTSG
jgi:hypothetical protein